MNRFDIIIVCANLITFFMYGLDKFFARHRFWRIPEYVLISVPFCLGGVGAFFGMLVFDHKIRRLEFRIVIPIAIVVNIITIFLFNNATL